MCTHLGNGCTKLSYLVQIPPPERLRRVVTGRVCKQVGCGLIEVVNIHDHIQKGPQS